MSKLRNLKKGDLVFHLLYGREWIGILLSLELETEGLGSPKELAKVRMQPGTKYEFFFRTKVSKKNRITDSEGYVSSNWLFKLEERDT